MPDIEKYSQSDFEKAKESCKNAKNDIGDHFADIRKMVEIGSDTKRNIDDIMLSRYACYLRLFNFSWNKGIAAIVFQPQSTQRAQSSAAFLCELCALCGFSNQKIIKSICYLDKNQKILDHMGSTELAANLFRATQTDDKLRRENIRGKEKANMTHFVVGKKVRQTIKELGGTMPEDLELPEKSIQEIEEKHKKRLLQGELE